MTERSNDSRADDGLGQEGGLAACLASAPVRDPRRAAAALSIAIDRQVLPRLAIALARVPAGAHMKHLKPTVDEVETLTRVLIHDADEGPACDLVAAVAGRGVPVESIYLDLLAPAAVKLGDMWVADSADFTDVTVGLGRLHAILRAMERRYTKPPQPAVAAPKLAAFAPTPGDQHSFGCVMVEAFFRRAGWSVYGWPLATSESLVDAVQKESFQLVGLSVSCESHLAATARHIEKIRSSSLNPAIVILAGGRIFSEQPELIVSVGADATGSNGPAAVRAAEDAMRKAAR